MAGQTFKEYFSWLKENWLNVGIMVGVFYTFLILVFRSYLDTLGLLIFFSLPIYVVHECEEYILPGGFDDFFNRYLFKADPQSSIQPIDREVKFWINVLYVYIFLPIGAWLYTLDPILAAWVPYYFLMHGIAHPILSIKGRRRYNGGMFTSVFVFLPYGCYMVHLFLQAGVLGHPVLNGSLLIGVGLNLLLPLLAVIPLPFGILSRYKRRLRQAGSTPAE